MTLPMHELGNRLSEYLTERWDDTVTITDLVRIPGGASRETYRMTASQGEGPARGIVVRVDPETSLIETERAVEYKAYAAIYPTAIPVPEPLMLEEDAKWLGQPFSVMAEVTGCQTETGGLSDEARERIGSEKWRLLGQLAALDPEAHGFCEFLPVPALDACAMAEVDYWAQMVTEDSLQPEPVAWAAIRWLRRHPPPPAQKLAVVHGDYRSRNFLFEPDDGIKAILDWEMCHLGDPLEDLAWSLDPLWSWPSGTLAGQLLPRADAIAHWEAASGLRADPEALRWWQVFASLKALAIWISSAEDFQNGTAKAPILAVAGWLMHDRQNRILVDALSPHSSHRYTEAP